MKLAIPTTLLVGLTSTLTTQAQASDLYELTLNNIAGTSQIEGYTNAIDITSWAFDISDPTTTNGSGAAKPTISPFTWTQDLDASITHEFQDAATGSHMTKVTLDVLKPSGAGGEDKIFEMVFTDAFISNFSLSAAPGQNPTADLALSFSKVSMQYWTPSPTGAPTPTGVLTWDILANTVTGDPLALQGLELQPVPEPESWALGLASLGMIGIASRFKRQS